MGSVYTSAQDLADWVQMRLGRQVTLVPGALVLCTGWSWCSGGAQSYFEDAIAAGARLYHG